MIASLCPRCRGPLSGPVAEAFCPRCAGRLLLDTPRSSAPLTDVPAQATSLRLGEYELGPEIGRGAMGVVYRARQPRLRRAVAVKVILASRFAGETARKRFLAEAELAAQLDHPNIVPIYEVGEMPDGPYYAMKLIEGGTLASVAAARASAATQSSDKSAALCRDAATLLANIARAVHHAHQRGVLHRDLKPGNILLDAQGEPHITDFGLARQLGVESSLTGTGSSLGTPAYMAPEQAAGERGITTAADIWSLGAIFFHLLTGRPPFMGATATDVLLQARTQEAPRLRSLNARIPADLETICLKCLEKDPTRRYSSAQRLAEDLERWHRHEPIEARPVSTVERVGKWVRRHPARAAAMLAFLALLLAGAGGVLWQWRRAEANAQESRLRLVRMATATANHRVEEGDLLAALPWFVEALRLETKGGRQNPESPSELSHRLRLATTLRQSPRLVQVWFHDSAVKVAAFSPNGRLVATHSDDGYTRVWEAQTGAAVTTPFRQAAEVWRAKFSSDSLQITLVSKEGQTKIWDARTGKLIREFSSSSDEESPLISDGNQIVMNGGSHVFVSDTNQGALTPPLRHAARVEYAEFSPDGALVLTASLDGTARLWNTATGQPVVPPLVHGDAVKHGSFSADSRLVVTSCDDHSARVWSATTGALLFPPLWHGNRVTHAIFSPSGEQVLTASSDGTARLWDLTACVPTPRSLVGEGKLAFAWFDRDHRRVITSAENNVVQVWDVERAKALSPPVQLDGLCETAALSPDGRRLTTGSMDNLARVWDVESGRLISVFKHNSRVRSVAWRFDGRAVVSAAADGARVWDSDSGIALAPWFSSDAIVNHAVFTPDGQRVATASHSRSARVWNVTTGDLLTPSMPHANALARITFSPDGKRVATASIDHTARIWNATTGQPLSPPLRHGNWVNEVVFSSDGQRLLTASDDGTARLWDGFTGDPITGSLGLGGGVWHPSFTRDGRRVLAANQVRAQIWDAATGEPLSPQLNPQAAILDVCFSPDERQVMAITADRKLFAWDITPLDWPLEDFASAARLMSGRQLDATGTLAPLEQALEGMQAGYPGSIAGDIADHSSDGPTRARILWRKDWERLQARIDSGSHRHLEAQISNTESTESGTPDPALTPQIGFRPITNAYPRRDPTTSPRLIDLTLHYNFGLTNSMHETPVDNSFSALKPGVHRLKGVDFDIRGLIHLAGDEGVTRKFPTLVSGIEIGRKANQVHFLQSCGWRAPDKTQIGSFIVHYTGGLQREIPIIYGDDVRDWHARPGEPEAGANAKVAWEGSNAFSQENRIRLFTTTWTNPLPDTVIVSLDYVSTGIASAPFLLAITAEE